MSSVNVFAAVAAVAASVVPIVSIGVAVLGVFVALRTFKVIQTLVGVAPSRRGVRTSKSKGSGSGLPRGHKGGAVRTPGALEAARRAVLVERRRLGL
jgi:hypothetical protein